jgi:expansin (peptidoglycan-binding protein)
MAQIVRVQHCEYDEVSLLAVQGYGTDKFQSSNKPKTPRANFGAVFTGSLRITNSANSGGYFFLLLDGTGRDRRVFFRGTAQVRIGGEVTTVADYYNMLALHARLRAVLAR